MLKSVIFCLCLAIACTSAASLNLRPVIGILTLPTTRANHTEYMAASYVKWVESAGARAAVIRYTATQEELEQLIPSLSGVLFTGGGTALSPSNPYFRTQQAIWKMIQTSNEQGSYYPIWGTCLGFEALSVLAAGSNSSVLDSFDAENITLPLDFSSGGAAANNSLMFDHPWAPWAFSVLAKEPVTMNNHQSGVTPQVYADNPYLSSFFNVLATSDDRQGKTFVTLVEGKTGWAFASQFHPEKIPFEWNPAEVMVHTADSVRVNNFFADFFVDRARMNPNRFPDLQSEDDALIYNYQPVWTQDVNHPDTSFTQEYLW